MAAGGQMSADTTAEPVAHGHVEDYQEHVRTYKGFVRAVLIVVAHSVAILVLMAIFLL